MCGWAGESGWTGGGAGGTRGFHPRVAEGERAGLVWSGNWGDGERTQELEDFLFRPAREAALPLDIYGVRYPAEALATLQRYGITYHGWAPNARAPEIFARAMATVHVPRRYYSTILPGIPTIRVFEALACGLPLVSAPWDDAEGLFRPGTDYLVARTGAEMTRHRPSLRDDPGLRAALAAHGLETIQARHTCAHRVDELLPLVAAPPPALAKASACRSPPTAPAFFPPIGTAPPPITASCPRPIPTPPMPSPSHPPIPFTLPRTPA